MGSAVAGRKVRRKNGKASMAVARRRPLKAGGKAKAGAKAGPKPVKLARKTVPVHPMSDVTRERRDVLAHVGKTQAHLTHHERAERRAAIASMVQELAGQGDAAALSKACREFGVTRAHVLHALKEHGIPVPEEPRPSSSLQNALRIVADLITTQDSYQVIAERRDVRKQWVHQIAVAATEAGIPLGDRVVKSDAS